MLTTKYTPLYFSVLLSFTPFSQSYSQSSQENTESDDIAVITVTATREEAPRAEATETSDVVNQKIIEEIKPAHPSELLNRVPGVHVNVTGGEGHMMSIRQPITTKPVYLYLENGIPTRSTGFFNHNALYETNVPQAHSVEVTKGPGTALYGSDAIGGVINVTTRPAPLDPELEVGIEGGGHGWGRVLLSSGNTWGDDGLRGDLNLTKTDGWRDNTEYNRQAGTLRWDSFLNNGASLETVLSGSKIDQQTAGSSRLSEDDYKNDLTKNYYGISYRDVSALRLSSAYEKEDGNTLFSVTPYFRDNSMEYMPNWSFSYDPGIKKTENQSFGLLLKYRIDLAPNRTRIIVGGDFDYSPGSREENYIDASQNSDGVYDSFTVQDRIYDYDVAYQGIAPYIHMETSPLEKLRITAGLRYDSVKYNYNNNMSSGTFRYTPSSMRFPMTINRPDDDKVSFSHWSPKIGAAYQFNKNVNAFISYRNAFRAPSEGQLFRPGSNQASLDLDPVKADSYEIGLRGKVGSKLNYEASIYYMQKKDDLVTYEDPATGDRFTSNAGETLHKGIELGADYQFNKQWNIAVSYSYTEQTYEDWQERGTDYSGNDLPSAPQDFANTSLNYYPTLLNGGHIELEWSYMGSYWMDNNNTTSYDGHNLLNLRLNHYISMQNDKKLELYARIINLSDERYATAASFSRGASTFSPGMERTIYAGFNYKL